MVAHRLVNVAIHQSMEQIWMEDYPVFIHDIICAEKVMLFDINEKLVIFTQKTEVI